MQCKWLLYIDLDLYVVDPGSPEFENFRLHFPECPNCAAALERISEFEELLSTSLADRHLSSEQIVALRRGAGTTHATARGGPNRHLSSCSRCRDALQALEAYSGR